MKWQIISPKGKQRKNIWLKTYCISLNLIHTINVYTNPTFDHLADICVHWLGNLSAAGVYL